MAAQADSAADQFSNGPAPQTSFDGNVIFDSQENFIGCAAVFEVSRAKRGILIGTGILPAGAPEPADARPVLP